MASIEIGESELKAQIRFIDTYIEYLGAELSNFKSSEFPLSEPDAYFEEPEETYADVMRQANVDDTAVIVYPFRPTTMDEQYTGDSTQYEQHNEAEMLVQAVMKFPGGGGANFPTIRKGTPYEREMTMRGWMSRRAKKYKAALMHTTTKHVVDGQIVEDVDIDSFDGEVQQPQDMRPVAIGSFIVGYTQDVLVPQQ